MIVFLVEQGIIEKIVWRKPGSVVVFDGNKPYYWKAMSRSGWFGIASAVL